MSVREGVREMHPQEDDALFSYSSKYSCSSSKMQVSDEVFRYTNTAIIMFAVDPPKKLADRKDGKHK